MPKFPVKFVAALALAGVSLSDLSSAPAQQPDVGEANISDSIREPITESEPLPIPGDSSGGGMISAMPAYPGGYGYGGYGGMDYSNMAGYPNVGTTGSSLHDHLFHHSQWYGYQSPGSQWNRPIRRPLVRVPVSYARYWPSSYYTGVYDPRAIYSRPLPMVYMPTDTTQLGFTHQRVPQWLPRPNAIPGPPWPPQWHQVMSVGGYGEGAGFDGFGYGGYSTGDYGAAGTFGEYCPPGSASDSNSTTAPAVINPEGTSPMGTGDMAPVAPDPAPPTE